MIIKISYPDKQDWTTIIEMVLRRCPLASISENNISFGNKQVGVFKFSDKELEIQGEWNRAVKCLAVIIAEMTGMVILGGAFYVDSQPADIEDLRLEVGELIPQENFKLEHKGKVIEKEIRMAKFGSQKIDKADFDKFNILGAKWDESLGQIILDIDEEKAMVLARKYQLDWWIKLET